MTRLLFSSLVAAALTGACVSDTDSPGTRINPADPTLSFLNFSVSPREQTIGRGQTATYTVTVTSKRNINARVALSATSIPGATITFNPQTLPDTGTRSTMTVQTSPTIVPQRAQITVTAAEEGGQTLPDFVNLTVDTGGTAPDFTVVVDQPSFALSPNGRRDLLATISSLNDFEGDVTLAFASPTPSIFVDGLSPPFHLVRGEKHDTGFTVFYRPGGTVSSPVVATLTATSGSQVRTQTLTISVGSVASPTPGSITSSP